MTVEHLLGPKLEHADDDAADADRDTKGVAHETIDALAQFDLAHRWQLAKILLGKPVADVRFDKLDIFFGYSHGGSANVEADDMRVLGYCSAGKPWR